MGDEKLFLGFTSAVPSFLAKVISLPAIRLSRFNTQILVTSPTFNKGWQQVASPIPITISHYLILLSYISIESR